MKKTTTALASFLGTLLLSALLPISSASADIYKWVDEKGVTNYAAEPPSSVDANRVKVQTRLPSGAESAVEGLEKQRSDARKAAEEAGRAPAPAAAKPDPAQYAERCKQLRADLKTMEEHAQIRLTDAKGETRTLTEEDKQKRMDETRRQIKGFCE